MQVLCARLVLLSGNSECTRHLKTCIHSQNGAVSFYDLEVWPMIVTPNTN